jgi:hypothetical protein
VAVEVETDLIKVSVLIILRLLKVIGLLSINFVALGLKVLPLLLAKSFMSVVGLLTAALEVQL